MQVVTLDTAVPVELADACFAQEFRETLVHQSVVAYLAGGRQGTRGQKTRAAVSGGGIKPFKQKGSGRARAGSIRSPLWRGGGKVFAATTRDFSQKLNRKMYRTALVSILSELVRQERLRVVEHFSIASGRTRDAVTAMQHLGVQSAVIVVASLEDNTVRALRNLPDITLVPAGRINPALLVGAETLILTKDAVPVIEEWLV